MLTRSVRICGLLSVVFCGTHLRSSDILLIEVTQRGTGALLEKRDLHLIDESGAVVVLTLWGEQARSHDVDLQHQAVGVKGASVREFNDLSFFDLITFSCSSCYLSIALTVRFRGNYIGGFEYIGR